MFPFTCSYSFIFIPNVDSIIPGTQEYAIILDKVQPFLVSLSHLLHFSREWLIWLYRIPRLTSARIREYSRFILVLRAYELELSVSKWATRGEAPAIILRDIQTKVSLNIVLHDCFSSNDSSLGRETYSKAAFTLEK